MEINYLARAASPVRGETPQNRKGWIHRTVGHRNRQRLRGPDSWAGGEKQPSLHTAIVHLTHQWTQKCLLWASWAAAVPRDTGRYPSHRPPMGCSLVADTTLAAPPWDLGLGLDTGSLVLESCWRNCVEDNKPLGVQTVRIQNDERTSMGLKVGTCQKRWNLRCLLRDLGCWEPERVGGVRQCRGGDWEQKCWN